MGLVTNACKPNCGRGTTLQYPCIEPQFSTVMDQIRDYVLGSPNCTCDAINLECTTPNRFPILHWLTECTPDSQRIDDLHREVLPADKQFEVPKLFRATVEVQPIQKMLKKYGMDVERVITVTIALPILEDLGLVEQLPKTYYPGNQRQVPDVNDKADGPLHFKIKEGDRFWYDNLRYRVLTVAETQFFGNTAIPLYLRIDSTLHRANVRDIETAQYAPQSEYDYPFD